jgi:nitrite reductase (NADH) large subunit
MDEWGDGPSLIGSQGLHRSDPINSVAQFIYPEYYAYLPAPHCLREDMPMRRYVILGNGVAGINAAETIRGLDPDGTIAMVSAEESLPYSRPMIAMVLEGSATPEQLPIRSPGYYDELGIESFLGHRAVELDLAAELVKTDRGAEIPYDKLLIATGSDPRHIKAEGTELKNIFYMRTESDVRGMLHGLDGVNKALVLGGGLVGFKAAYGLMHRGVEVTMLIRSGHPLSMQVDAEAGALIQEELEKNGLKVMVNIAAEAFEGNGAVQKAHLSDGSVLDCQMVVVGKGVIPAVEFVPRDRIEVDYGIRVDDHLQTAIPNVYAAGDVAESKDRLRGEPWVNAIWPVAVEQGKIAGANMAGRSIAYPGSMGRNVMRVMGLDVLSGGLASVDDDGDLWSLSRFEPRKRMYRKLVLRGTTLVGATMIGAIEQGGVLLSLIQRGEPLRVEPEKLLEPSFNFATLLP